MSSEPRYGRDAASGRAADARRGHPPIAAAVGTVGAVGAVGTMLPGDRSVRAPGGRRSRTRTATVRPAVGDARGPCPGLLIADWADPRWTERAADSILVLFDRSS